MVFDSRVVLRFKFSRSIEISEVFKLPGDGDTTASGLKIGIAPCSSFRFLVPSDCLPLRYCLPSLALQSFFGKILHIEGKTGIICYCQRKVNDPDTKPAS